MATPNPFPFFPTGSVGWFVVNVNWDVWLGIGAFLILTKLIPRLIARAQTITWHDSKTGKLREAPVHPKWFVLWAWVTIITLVVALWGIFLTLVFSTGWHNPFASVQWEQLPSMPGWFFDLVYARANDQPDGAHILSWLMAAGFGIAVWLTTIKRPLTHFRDLLGDPYQGIAALVFIGGLHELMWVPFFYAAYAQYLTWDVLIPVLRDISFAFMMAMFILTWWKYPGRTFPLSKLRPVIYVYVAYLVLWFVVPYVLTGVWFPVTTLNNPNFGVGPYQETPYFTLWWVNMTETISWLLIGIPSMILVIRYQPLGRWRAAQKAELKFQQATSSVPHQESDDLVLEVGCGPTSATPSTVGVDPLASEYAYDGGEHIAAVAESLPFWEGAFDAVVCDNSIDHMIEPEASVREMGKVLKAGGRLRLSVNTFRFAKGLLGLIDRPHPHHYSFGEADRLVRNSGMVLASAKRIEPPFNRGWKAWAAKRVLFMSRAEFELVKR